MNDRSRLIQVQCNQVCYNYTIIYNNIILYFYAANTIQRKFYQNLNIYIRNLYYITRTLLQKKEISTRI